MRLLPAVLVCIGTLTCFAECAYAGPSKEVAKRLVEEFNQSLRPVRKEHLKLPVSYIEYNGAMYAYFLPRKLARLAHSGDTFAIEKLESKEDHLVLRLESSRGAKVHCTLYDEAGRLTQDLLDEVFPRMLSEVFDFREPSTRPLFVGNTQSRTIHLGNCNHLPAPAERLEILRLEHQPDYRRCPICFSEAHMLPIEGYSLMREEQLENARLYELAFPPVEDPRVQSAIQSVGDSILARFPIPLKGFDYVFKVVVSETFNATSFPTGFVYVTNELMRAIEDPAELSFVLAHEIAHVELYRREPKPFFVTEGAAKRHYEGLRLQETSSDLIALLYLVQNDDRPDVVDRALQILRKLQFAKEARSWTYEEGYATHPSLRSRIAFLDTDKYRMSVDGKSFCGLDRTGETLCRLQVLGKAKTREKTVVYILFETTDFIDNVKLRPKISSGMWGGSSGRGRVGKFEDAAGHNYELENVFGTLLISERDLLLLQLVVGGEKKFEEVNMGTPRKLELFDIDGVKEWAVCGE